MIERGGYPVNGGCWVRTIPDRCEMCGHPILVTFYHAPVKGGSFWAVMCPTCYLDNDKRGARFLINGESATMVGGEEGGER